MEKFIQLPPTVQTTLKLQSGSMQIKSRPLGQGMGGIVYRVENSVTGKLRHHLHNVMINCKGGLAVKIISNTTKPQHDRETRILDSIVDDSSKSFSDRLVSTIVHWYAADSNISYYVMPYYDNATLEQYLAANGDIIIHDSSPIEVRLAIIIGLTRAMLYLKQRNVIQLDLKPLNCVFSNEGSWEIKLVDYGSSVFADENMPSASYQPQNPSYRAPEVLLRLIPSKNPRQPFTHKADSWSLCVLANSLLTGNRLQKAVVITNANRPHYSEQAIKIIAQQQLDLMNAYPVKSPTQAEVVSGYVMLRQYHEISLANPHDHSGLDFVENVGYSGRPCEICFVSEKISAAADTDNHFKLHDLLECRDVGGTHGGKNVPKIFTNLTFLEPVYHVKADAFAAVNTDSKDPSVEEVIGHVRELIQRGVILDERARCGIDEFSKPLMVEEMSNMYNETIKSQRRPALN